MTHPWNKSRPLSAWIPSGYSEERASGNNARVPVVNADECTMCGLCWLFCPEGIITREGEIRFRYEFCRGCGVCETECPKQAITLIEEKASGGD